MATNPGMKSNASSSSQCAFESDVKEFSNHCAYIRTVYVLAIRIWRDSSDEERKMMEGISPSFFLDMGQSLLNTPFFQLAELPIPPTAAAKTKTSPSSFSSIASR